MNTPPPATQTRPGVVLFVVSAAAFLASLDLFIVNIALPAIRLAFPGDLATASWVLNGYTVMFAALLAPAGRLADRYGRRRVFLLGTAVFTIGSAMCALAPSLLLLVAFRAFQAIGAALVMPTSLALLLEAFPAAKRAVAVSTWAATGGVAAAVGPPLGGLLVPLSWRWVFLVNLPVGVLALIFGPRVLRESKESGSGMPDLLGAVGLVAGIGGLAWALVTGPDDGWTSPGVLIALGLTVVGLLWVVLRSVRHPVPVLDLPALRVPTMWLACLAMLLFMTGFGSMLFGNVLFLTSEWHNSPIIAGLSLSPGPAMVVVVSLTIGGRLARRLGPGPVAALGSLSFALGAAEWVWRVSAVPHYTADLLPGQIFTGIGVGLVLPSLSGVVGSALPAPRWGAGSSMINTARQIGTVLSTAILVVLYGPVPNMAAFRRGWIFLSAAALAAALVACVIASRRNADDHPQHFAPEQVSAWLHGQARQPHGMPLAGAAVTLIDPSGRQLDATVTDENGVFRFDTPPEVHALLVASCRGHHPEVIEIPRGHRSTLEVVLAATRGGVSGVVTDSDGVPVPAATMVLSDWDGAVVGSRRTSQDGHYRFDGLAASPLLLTTAVNSRQVQVERITVVAGEYTPHDVVLPALWRVSGFVRHGRTPVTRARVTLLDSGGNILASRDTSESGHYEFPSLPRGDYRVVAGEYPPASSTVRVAAHTRYDIELRHDFGS